MQETVTTPVKPAKKKESIGEIVRTIIYALLIALSFRIVAFQPFSIPSGSMKSTLLIGDYLFVSKYAYGYSRHSLPFSIPLFSGRIFATQPKRGDVIVFKYPKDNRTDYIKRLVGLPGDRIQMKSGVLYINDVAVKMEREDDFLEPYKPGGMRCINTRVVDDVTMCVKEAWRETFPDGRSHTVLNSDSNQGFGDDNTQVFLVPKGHYFFMGDNRDNSTDSRFPSAVGFVPAENLVGRAELIFLSSSGSPFAFWNWRIGRFLTLIR